MKRALAPIALCASLAGCGGGGGAETSTGPAAPVDHRVTLSQYAATRSASVPALPPLPPAQTDSLTVTVSALAQPSSTSYENLFSVPALQSSLRSLLLAAARGDTRSQVLQQLPDPGPWSAQAVDRTIWAPATALLEPNFLRATDLGADPAAPSTWRSITVTKDEDFSSLWAAGFSPAALEMEAGASLVLMDRVERQFKWPNASAPYLARVNDGVMRNQQAVVRDVQGPMWSVTGNGWTASGLVGPDGTLVRLSPHSATDLQGLGGDRLGAALAQLRGAMMGPLPTQPGAWVVAAASPGIRASIAPLPAALGLPFDKERADLGGATGTPSYARLATAGNSLTWDGEMLRLTASWALAIGPRTNATGGGSTGGSGVSTNPSHLGCPTQEVLVQPQVWIWFDREGRIILLTALVRPVVTELCGDLIVAPG